VQDEFALIPNKFSLTIGTKLEHNNYTGFEVQPSVRILWTISSKQTVWAAVTRAVRSPSRIEEDFQLTGFLVADPLIYLAIDGNKKLSSEDLLGYEAGYRTRVRSKLYVDLAVFYNQYNNLVDLGTAFVTADSTPQPDHLTIHFPWANGIKGSTQGFEISPDWRPSRWWQAKATYSYVNLNLKNKPGNTNTGSVSTDEGSSPHNQFTIESRFNLPKGFEFDQTYRHVGALPAQLVSSYGTGDAHLSWQATRHFAFAVVGENLLQPEHAEFSHAPGPIVGIKRSVYAKITWRQAAD
jgi:iron complex outermembrane receptor protein